MSLETVELARQVMDALSSRDLEGLIAVPEDLPKEVQCVAQRDIAGARYVPPSYGRVMQSFRVPA